MEPNCNTQIIILLEQVICLLINNSQEQWGHFLQNAKNNFIESKNKKEAIEPIIKSMLGGAGSLSDVVLYREGKLLVDENNQLYDLLNKLYDECKNSANF